MIQLPSSSESVPFRWPGLPEIDVTYRFTANKFEADEGQQLVGFANDEQYVWMQPDEGHPPSSHAGNVWIEIHDQQFGGRGGIQQIQLTRRGLRIWLTPTKAKKMGGHDEIAVLFDVPNDEFDRIKAVLGAVLRGSESILEIIE